MKQWLETRQVLERLAELGRAGTLAALATVIRVRGSAYRHEGAKLLVAADGSVTDNVSGGCLEQDVREVAHLVIRAAWDLGVGCEGQVDVLVEPAFEPRLRERQLLDGREPFAVATFVGRREAGGGTRVIVTGSAGEGDVACRARELIREGRSALEDVNGRPVFMDVFVPPPELILCGAGDDARALVRCATEVGFRVTVVDRRPAYLAPERFPAAARLLHSDAAQLGERLPLDEACYAVVMTHNFADDRAYAQALLATPVSYVGMLGPRQRTERILRDVPTAQGGRVYGPVGLDIGTDGAEQVALSVVAEILAVRSGRRARSLRERGAPIHARDD